MASPSLGTNALFTYPLLSKNESLVFFFYQRKYSFRNTHDNDSYIRPLRIQQLTQFYMYDALFYNRLYTYVYVYFD